MEVEADLLGELNFNNFKTLNNFSWETKDEESWQSKQICASECTNFPFAPELCTESLLSNQEKITARIIRNESDLGRVQTSIFFCHVLVIFWSLFGHFWAIFWSFFGHYSLIFLSVMDFAFLLCGWESRSIQFTSTKGFILRYKLFLPGVSHSIIEEICANLNQTAIEVLILEQSFSNLGTNSSIHFAFGRAVIEQIRLHRTLVLKLGTVKSLPLFVKLTRRCCDGIRFISQIFHGIDFNKTDAHMLLALLSFVPFAHGKFEKKLLSFLLKSCTRPYLNFIDNIMKGIIVENQVEDFCAHPIESDRKSNINQYKL